MEDLLINGKDAYVEWGIKMGSEFLDALGAFPTIKDYVENESRLEDGKRVTAISPKIAASDITLTFNIEGKTHNDFIEKKKSFIDELIKGDVTIQVPKNGNEVYHLLYQRGTSYAQNIMRTACKVACKFTEANPANRI